MGREKSYRVLNIRFRLFHIIDLSNQNKCSIKVLTFCITKSIMHLRGDFNGKNGKTKM